MAVSRRHLIGLLVIEVALFVVSGVTAKNSNHPGTVSNVFWVIFLIGILVLIVLVVVALVQSRRSRAG
jgi:hypothetical protein